MFSSRVQDIRLSSKYAHFWLENTHVAVMLLGFKHPERRKRA
jgi:hypothetical protein